MEFKNWILDRLFGVEHTVRQKKEEKWHFLFNNTGREQEFQLHWRLPVGVRDTCEEAVHLQPFEMKMWKEED